MFQLMKNQDTGMTDIFEVASGIVIDSCVNWNEAAKKVRFWKRGGGFRGFTPQFMTVKVK